MRADGRYSSRPVLLHEREPCENGPAELALTVLKVERQE